MGQIQNVPGPSQADFNTLSDHKVTFPEWNSGMSNVANGASGGVTYWAVNDGWYFWYSDSPGASTYILVGTQEVSMGAYTEYVLFPCKMGTRLVLYGSSHLLKIG